MSKDLVVIGGGMIGCSIARQLARAGLKVTLVERGRIGERASWAATGILAPQTQARQRPHILNLSIRSRALWPRFADELKEESGLHTEYRTDGAIYVASAETDRRQLDSWLTLK